MFCLSPSFPFAEAQQTFDDDDDVEVVAIKAAPEPVVQQQTCTKIYSKGHLDTDPKKGQRGVMGKGDPKNLGVPISNSPSNSGGFGKVGFLWTQMNRYNPYVHMRSADL